jgi:hypothetical protein
MSPLDFFEWVGDSDWSTALHESQYAYSIIESVHVWTMAVFFGLVAIFDLRLLGFTMRQVPVSEVIRRLQPWTIVAFVIMVITGSLLFYAIPVRSYQSIFFRTKMLLMLLAGVNLWLFHSRVFPRVAGWDLEGVPPGRARLAGALSLLLWGSIIFSGRMIAYNWFDCDRQPQPDIVNALTSCDPSRAEQ